MRKAGDGLTNKTKVTDGRYIRRRTSIVWVVICFYATEFVRSNIIPGTDVRSHLVSDLSNSFRSYLSSSKKVVHHSSPNQLANRYIHANENGSKAQNQQHCSAVDYGNWTTGDLVYSG